MLADALGIIMFVVTCGLLMLGFPVAFTLAGSAVLFSLLGTALGIFDFSFLSAFPQRVFGIMTNEVLVAVPVFIFMGLTLERSKVAEELLETMASLFGKLRGGLTYSVTIVGLLLAASTGIVGASVVTMGLLSLPTMLKHGYDSRLACGSICAAGTLGQLIPPSIVLILLGDTIATAYQEAQYRMGVFATETVSVGQIFAGALLPGLVLAGLYLAYQAFVAWRRPDAAPAIPREAFGHISRRRFAIHVLRALLLPLLLIVAVLGSIMAGIAAPSEAASVGAVGALLLAAERVSRDEGRSPWPAYAAGVAIIVLIALNAAFDLRVLRSNILLRDMLAIAAAAAVTLVLAWSGLVSLARVLRAGVLVTVMKRTLEMTTMVFIILVGATLFTLAFRGYGGDDAVHEILTSLPGGTLSAIVAVMFFMFLLGFFLDYIEIIFVVVPIVAPVLLQMGVEPVWLAIMMGLNLQTSFLTPPFGFSLFYLRGVAPDTVATGDIYRGIVPFIAFQLVALGVLAAFPPLATWLPGIVFGQ